MNSWTGDWCIWRRQDSGRVASGEIYYALKTYERQTGAGYALGDNVGVIVNLPHRRSFSPDAAFVEHLPENPERFVDGAPLFVA